MIENLQSLTLESLLSSLSIVIREFVIYSSVHEQKQQ